MERPRMGAGKPRMRGRSLAVLLLTLTLALTGCSFQTFGAPKGKVHLTAVFDDAQGLVAGHSVQMSDVKIGTVLSVKREGYKAKVTMAILDKYHLPQGTRAEIKVTSLLGENYVDMILPPGGSMNQGPFLANGARIQDATVQPAFEQVVGQTGPLLKSLAGNDVATIVNAGAQALDGQGHKLNKTVKQTGDLVKLFADQRAELGESIDQFARLGRSLAAGKDALGQAPVEIAKTTDLLNKDKDKILKTIDRLTYAAAELNDKVLAGRVATFRRLLNDVDPIVAQLGSDRTRLTNLVNGLVAFEKKLPLASYDGSLMMYPVLRLVWPDGTPVLPGLGGGGGSGGSGGGKKPKASNPLPPKARDTFPNLDSLLEPPR
ncbi:MlaD family protein [Actinomadura rupiterrae]|uniref:MlaD family protein n=1 Tax=Actinomadura rupiterrae TaxID=559627 RepID=UPI0020A32891|nr:MCE family protein [Actinomadura rupiterrae]MCP2334775.1 phospholipid/cholesterol/gamma-HCH transport system substrate-binding protein [Actinomadura rupiterrae]